MVEVPKIKLNSGYEIPQVGFGLWKVAKESAADIVYQAIKAGYRLFDCAFYYGNEREAGLGVKRAIDEGIVKREDLAIVSKLWCAYHEKERVEPIVRQQLEWWGIDYFDVFYIHFPIALEYRDPSEFENNPVGWRNAKGQIAQGKTPIQETWQAMEHLVDIGLAKSIGICNFQGSLIVDLLRYARIRPAILQLEIHPYLVQEEIVRFAQSENIAVTAFSSFGPLSFVELDSQKAIDLPSLFDLPVVSSLAQKYSKTAAQVLLRWATQRGLAVIPKTSDPKRLIENLDCNGFDLTPNEMKAISALNKNIRFNNPVDFVGTLYIFA